MPITLTIKDRYELAKYTNKLQCTLPLRNVVDGFFAQIELSDEERAKFDVKISKETFELTSNDDSYAVTYESFPLEVTKAISSFVKSYDTEEGQKSQIVRNALEIFKKVV